jgi:HKD family nuclease
MEQQETSHGAERGVPGEMSTKTKPSSVAATLIHNVDTEEHHAALLVERLRRADRFICVVAFAKMAGFKLLSKPLKERIAAGMSARFVVGVDFYQTEPELILELIALRDGAPDPDEVEVYMGAEERACTLHPKVYVFAGNGPTTAIVGSANMTGGGLRDNWETSALLAGHDVDWEASMNGWIDDRVEEEEIVEADAGVVARYKHLRDIYRIQMDRAEKRAKRALEAPPGDFDTLGAVLAKMRADDTKHGFAVQVSQRAAGLGKSPAILARIAHMRNPTPSQFLQVYETLLFGSVWHSGGLQRGKTIIAKQPTVFRDALIALARSKSKDPRVVYDLLLTFMVRVPSAGVNVMTEILHTRDAARFPVMNRNSVAGMALANIVDYPKELTKDTVDGRIYARFCADAEKIRVGLGLANFSELDAVLNYAYWGH